VKHRVPRLLGSLPLLLAAAIVFASPVAAASPKRVFRTSLTGGHGSATLTLLTTYAGSIAVQLNALTPNTTYQLMVYKGACASPTALAKLAGVRTDATGTGSGTIQITSAQGHAIWGQASRGAIAFRAATGTERRCAVFGFATATRIQVSRYGIDLPVVYEPAGKYPYCNVAMYLSALSQPGEAGPTFIYAHARAGMFLPLLNASKVRNGAAMIGATVKVWNSDSKLFTYTISKVLRNQFRLPAYNPNSEILWLQTSEGPHGTAHKLIIEARRVAVRTVSFAEAHPTPHIVRCGF
jgi:hypothetical protein